MKTIIALLAAILLAGCTSVGEVKPESQAPSQGESMFVIGLAPSNYRISVWPGYIKDGHFYKSQLRNAALYSAAYDGYVVGEAKAGEVLGITNARIVENKNSILGLDYRPCKDVLVFKVPAGKVIYLGDITFSFDSNTVGVRQSRDNSAAASYFHARYPAIAQRIVPVDFQHMPFSGCNAP